MSTIPLAKVYLGFWINHSRNDVLGSTITLKSEHASIIVAFLSILIAFAGSHFWALTALILFRYKATTKPQDALHHQKQSILKNGSAPGTVVLALAKVGWRWRGQAQSLLNRLLWISLLAFVYGAGFLVAGILSSQIIDSGDIDVLAVPSHCGLPVILSAYGTQRGLIESYAWLSAQQAQRYASTCYDQGDSIPACQVWTQKAIPFNSTYATCPFDGFCTLPSPKQALKMDTGFMDTNDIFGINARTADRLLFKKVTACAPLNVTAYSRIVDIDEAHVELISPRQPLPGEQIFQTFLGPTPMTNETAFGSMYGLNFSSTYGILAHAWHTHNSRFEQSQWSADSTVEPLTGLRRTDADTVLIGITQNLVQYASPVDDPIFAAHQRTNIIHGINNVTAYSADLPSQWLGCSEQYQICLPHGRCTSLTGIVPALNTLYNMKLSAQQNATLFALAATALFGPTDIGSPAGLKAGAILKANAGQAVTLVTSLPPDQWEIEVKGIEATVLTLFQMWMTDMITGFILSNDGFESMERQPTTAADQKMCNSMRMKAPNGVSNISVLGLALVVSICGTIILADLMTSTILRFLFRKSTEITNETKGLAVATAQWHQEGALQVQQQAFQGLGVIGWDQAHREVPIRTAAIPESFPDLNTTIRTQQGSAARTSSTVVRSSSESIAPKPAATAVGTATASSTGSSSPTRASNSDDVTTNPSEPRGGSISRERDEELILEQLAPSGPRGNGQSH